MARIVLLDDEPQLLRTLARFLERDGHKVLAAERFRDAGEQLWPGRFDVLVTDIVMPELDGMGVLREVVHARECREPVILITGEPNLETATEAVRQGAFDYISKPVTKDSLLEVVSRGLRHVSLLRERDQARQVELDVLRNLARLGESASVLTHEIRTPMTSLRQALRAVGDKLGIGDKALIEELLKNLDRIEVMLGRTLSFVRPLRLHQQRVSVGNLIESARAQAVVVPVMKDMQVQIRMAEDLPMIEGDPQLLAEVFVNLLHNAAEACGGKGRIEISASLCGSKVVVDVRDDGPGVPMARRDEIFRPFHSSKDYGTGIGLAFCRKVIESHGGTIGLTDEPPPGACFRVELKPGGA